MRTAQDIAAPAPLLRPLPPPLPRSAVARRAVDGMGDDSFLWLLSAYRATGGLATGTEIAARPDSGGFLPLARLIAQRRVLSFVWRNDIWLPYFQFMPGGHTVHPEVQLLTDTLSGALDDAALAAWFVEPNSWLDDATPLALLPADFARVHEAARALQFAHCN